MSTVFAFLHHVFAFTLVACIAIEFTLLRQEFSLGVARRLLATDAVLGASAGLLLIVGLLRVFYFEKGAAYYFQSHGFMMKLAVFIAIALLSIVPTLEFLSWRKPLKAGTLPVVDPGKMRRVRAVVHGELAAILLILLGAALMARGGFV